MALVARSTRSTCGRGVVSDRNPSARSRLSPSATQAGLVAVVAPIVSTARFPVLQSHLIPLDRECRGQLARLAHWGVDGIRFLGGGQARLCHRVAHRFGVRDRFVSIRVRMLRTEFRLGGARRADAVPCGRSKSQSRRRSGSRTDDRCRRTPLLRSCCKTCPWTAGRLRGHPPGIPPFAVPSPSAPPASTPPVCLTPVFAPPVPAPPVGFPPACGVRTAGGSASCGPPAVRVQTACQVAAT
jgi:hypothetical protein